MNRRIFIVLLSAFLIAVACSYIVYRLVGNRLSGPHKATTRVVAAANDIKLGAVLRDADLTTVEITGMPCSAAYRLSAAICGTIDSAPGT